MDKGMGEAKGYRLEKDYSYVPVSVRLSRATRGDYNVEFPEHGFFCSVGVTAAKEMALALLRGARTARELTTKRPDDQGKVDISSVAWGVTEEGVPDFIAHISCGIMSKAPVVRLVLISSELSKVEKVESENHFLASSEGSPEIFMSPEEVSKMLVPLEGLDRIEKLEAIAHLNDLAAEGVQQASILQDTCEHQQAINLLRGLITAIMKTGVPQDDRSIRALEAGIAVNMRAMENNCTLCDKDKFDRASAERMLERSLRDCKCVSPEVAAKFIFSLLQVLGSEELQDVLGKVGEMQGKEAADVVLAAAKSYISFVLKAPQKARDMETFARIAGLIVLACKDLQD